MGVRMNTSEASKTLWGCFSAQDVETHSLELRPDVVAMSRGGMYLASCSNILRYGHGFVGPRIFPSRRTLQAIGFRCSPIHASSTSNSST